MRVSRLLLLVAVSLGLLFARPAAAGDPSAHIRSAEIQLNGEGYDLDATFEIDLGTTLEEALHRGVPLYFATEFQLVYERWYLLNLWNRKVAAFERTHRLTYHALTRQYRLTAGALTQSVETLTQALAIMGRVSSHHFAPREDLEPGVIYAAQIRFRLDPTQLPKPFLINSIGSRSWNLSSDWYRWAVTP